MTVCGSCGSAEDGGAFCGACGDFLEFVGVPAQVGPPDRQPPGARALLAPGTVDAVLPGVEAERRTARRRVQQLAPGDLPCSACGSGNPAGRAFCRRCGTVLAVDAPAAPLSWWRRLLAAARGRWQRRRAREAGARPRRWDRHAPARRQRRGPVAWLRRISLPMHLLTPVLLVLCLLGVTVPSLRQVAFDGVGSVTAHVRRVVAPELVPVRPVAVTASSAVPGQPPDHAVDGVTTTSWAEAAPGDGVGQVLVLEYDRPVDLRRIGVRLGAAGPPESYAQQPRPERVRLVAGDATQSVVLRDTVELQDHDVDLDDVQRLEIHLESVFGGQAGSDASITEVTAFTVR